MSPVRGFAPTPLLLTPERKPVPQNRGAASEPQPTRPLRGDDADHIRVVAEAGDTPFLDGDQPELPGLADRVLHRPLGHTSYGC